MKTYTGKASTLDAAIKLAAQAAVVDIGPDALVEFGLTEVRGVHGGLLGRHEVEADITVRSTQRDQLCTDVSEYRAYQQQGSVTVLAYGQHSSAGYIVSLDRARVDITPPQFVLTHRELKGPAAQVITSFVVSASFEWSSMLDSIRVQDGKGLQEVAIMHPGM